MQRYERNKEFLVKLPEINWEKAVLIEDIFPFLDIKKDSMISPASEAIGAMKKDIAKVGILKNLPIEITESTNISEKITTSAPPIVSKITP